jgi:ATP-dependent Clp protease ATP-binding subunit ClpB
MNLLLKDESVNQVVKIAKALAKENYNSKYSAPHILRALMHKDVDLHDFLISIEKDPLYFQEWAEVRIEDTPKVTRLPEEIVEDASLASLWENSEDVRVKLGLLEITPICLLAGLIKPNSIFTSEQLKSLPLKESDIFSVFQNPEKIKILKKENRNVDDLKHFECSKFKNLNAYCVNLTSKDNIENSTSLIGREKEIRSLIEILGRKSKPNVILVGEPGVGKTAMIEGFAKHLVTNKVTNLLSGCDLFQIDLGLLMAGTSYKGEVEERLKKIIQESKEHGKSILYIDEIHSLLDNKSNLAGLANLLKPELARGEITLIGTTTFEEYRKLIEPELAFNRRFEYLEIIEPDEQTCVKMLQNVVKKYEDHHSIKVDNNALLTCVRLAKRYSKEKKLPDTALDLLDRTMSALSMLSELSISELESWQLTYMHIYNSEFSDKKEKIENLLWMYGQLKNLISPILWGMLDEQPELDSTYSIDKINEIINKTYEELFSKTKLDYSVVGNIELAAVMSSKTGIPLGKIQAQEKEKLLLLEQLLKNRVVGQDHALQILADAIVESRSGLNKPGQPIGSFFFLGPTGTGKTELAKAIAELLFNDEKAMIRFDMSEFKEEHSAALLYGAPPGYVGYEEGGILVNKIRQQPYAVVLFDEIEKAHQSVFDIFLQIMDEGKIHDKLGKEGDFSNALILFTSNIGSEFIVNEFAKGLIPSSKALKEIMTKQFRPEFLARITEIIPFSPITEPIAEQIFKIQIKSLIKSLDRLAIGFEITEQAIKHLTYLGFNAQYGARQISGIIRQELARPISRMIVKESVKPTNIISVLLENNNLLFKIIENNKE